jgi:DNA polymerase-3 subunit delta
MSFLQFKKEINQGQFKPIYLLMGEETYFIDALTRLIEQKALAPEEKSFNQSILYGKETSVANVVAEAKRYPIMAERVLVMVKEAQSLPQIAELESYAENPQPSTVLVLAYKHKKLDKRTKLFKLISNLGGVLESKRLYDSQIPEWMETYLSHLGYPVTQKALRLLSESLGNDLSRITNELNKLKLIIPAQTTLTDELIEKHIGISKDYNTFELQDAIGKMNFTKAIRIQKYFEANPKSLPLILTVATLYRFFRMIMLVHQNQDKSKKAIASLLKVNPFFVQDYMVGAQNYSLKKCARAISHIRECDMRSKGLQNARTSAPDLLKELIFKIFYV